MLCAVGINVVHYLGGGDSLTLDSVLDTLMTHSVPAAKFNDQELT